jgi:hypothetical protein
VEPVISPTMLSVTIKMPLPYIDHCQDDRAKRLEVLRKETQQYTLEKPADAYHYHILEFKSIMKTVFKEYEDKAQIIRIHKLVDFLYYQCYRDQGPDQAAVTRKRRGLNIKAKLKANVWASMTKKEITKIRVREQGVKKKFSMTIFMVLAHHLALLIYLTMKIPKMSWCIK